MFSPITTKDVQSGVIQNVVYAVSNMQGWRSTQEDTHVVKCNFPGNALNTFAVFDGHGGTYSSHYMRDNFVNIVKDRLVQSSNPAELSGLLEDAFLEADRRIFETAKSLKEAGSGTTACVCMYGSEKIVTAWAGDSRAVLCRQGKAVPLTTQDHKPSLETERNRIEKCGGSVVNNRVNGILAVSRSLGDFNFKDASKSPEKYVVSGIPEIFEIERNDEEDEFLLLACDGIWDVMSNQKACTFVRKRVQRMMRQKGLTKDIKVEMVEKIACELLDECLRLGSKDNMTCTVVVFGGSRSIYRTHNPMSAACSLL